MRMNLITAPAIAARVAHLTDSLAGLSSLAPGDVVDGLFGELVSTVLAAPEESARDVLADPGVRARKALLRKTGARGLRSILEQSLIDTMFDLPTTANVAKVVLDESTIEENQPPLLVYREAAKKA